MLKWCYADTGARYGSEPSMSSEAAAELAAAAMPRGRDAFMRVLKRGMEMRAHEVLDELTCPISWETLRDPVCTSDGNFHREMLQTST